MINNSDVTLILISSTPFFCDCGWTGRAHQLDVSHLGFSCCPVCSDLDIRVDLTILNRGSI
jgi:hypothetical protein